MRDHAPHASWVMTRFAPGGAMNEAPTSPQAFVSKHSSPGIRTCREGYSTPLRPQGGCIVFPGSLDRHPAFLAGYLLLVAAPAPAAFIPMPFHPLLGWSWCAKHTRAELPHPIPMTISPLAPSPVPRLMVRGYLFFFPIRLL